MPENHRHETSTPIWTYVQWGNADYMFVAMLPGTGDVPLTVCQSLPIDGIVMITPPQNLVRMIVGKAVKMLHISVISIVENMLYVGKSDNWMRFTMTKH